MGELALRKKSNQTTSETEKITRGAWPLASDWLGSEKDQVVLTPENQSTLCSLISTIIC